MNSQTTPQSQKNHLTKTIATGLILALGFATLAHGAVEPWSIFLFNLIVLLLLLLWAVKAVADGRIKIVIPKTVLPVAALLAVGLLQSIAITNSNGRWLSLSKDVGATRATVTTLFFLLSSFVIASNFFASRTRLIVLAKSLVLFGLAVALFALIQYFTWNGSFYWIRPTQSPTPFGPFANHNHFAGFMEMIIPLPVALIITRAVRGELRLLFGFAAVLMGVAVITSLSRGGMISLAASMLFVLAMSFRLRNNHRRKKPQRFNGRMTVLNSLFHPSVSAVVICALILGSLLWIGADPVINRISQNQSADTRQAETFFTSRGWVWKDTLAMIGANPVLGVGLGAYRTAFPIYTESDGSLIVPQAHNDYLQIVADSGLVGGLIALWFIALISGAVLRGIKSRDDLLAGLALGSGAGIFAMLVHSLLDFNLQLPSNALLFLLLSAIATLVGAAADKSKAVIPVSVRGEAKQEVEKAVGYRSAS